MSKKSKISVLLFALGFFLMAGSAVAELPPQNQNQLPLGGHTYKPNAYKRYVDNNNKPNNNNPNQNANPNPPTQEVTIPNDGNSLHTISGIGKIVGGNFDPKNVRVSLNGGTTWIVPDSVVVRPDGTFAWAMSTSSPPGKITVYAAIVNPQTNAVVKTEQVGALQVSQNPPQVVAAARAVEAVSSTTQQQQQQQQQSESQINNPVLIEQVRQAASPS